MQKRTMHDRTLESISVEWESGTATFALKAPRTAATLVGHDVRSLQMPRRFAWGPSVSVNETDGPTLMDTGLLRVSIEMQSGDTSGPNS
jgi:hypothetical protein